MSSPISNRNPESSATPLAYSKNYFKPPARKLWHKKDLQIHTGKCFNYGTTKKETWDRIDSPQFVDFSKLPTTSDSFFSKSRVIVSTPRPNSGYENSINAYDDNTVIESLETFSLSGIDHISPVQEISVITGKEQTEEISQLNDTVIKVEMAQPEIRHEGGNPREKCEQEKTTECFKKSKMFQPWKKPPFVPCLTTKDQKKPKDPSLRTMIRAEERKRFDMILKEKETQREERKRMQIAAKKVEEEKEIALLRKQTVHKAQPIRKYKMGLPEIRKRPLTNPVTPLTLKRRRIGTENVM